MLVAVAMVAAPLHAQSRQELEKRRDALDKRIKQTSIQLDQARSEQRSTQQQMELIEARINQRRELINTMNSEVLRMDQAIAEARDSIRLLQKNEQQLKEEYARMLQFAYMNRSSYDRLSYIFAAESFAQAYRRSRYLDQLAHQRTEQAQAITRAQQALQRKTEDLQATRADKGRLLERQLAEARNMDKDRKAKGEALAALRKKEGELKQTLAKQEKQRQELAAAIRKAIEEEIARSRAAAAKAAGTAAAPSGFAMTPEAKELNADFEKNRGKLPWPVERGTITSRFGKQPHPVLKGIQIENNGVDIRCEPGAPVRALFRGTVSSVIVIPGAGKAVMVSHGAYRTVYSNLRDVAVSKGQQVETKQVVGTVMTEDGTSTAHLEVWKIEPDGSLHKVNPESWIMQ